MPARYTEEAVLRQLAEALEIDPRSLGKETMSRDVEGWDSLGTMNILFWLNAEFGIKLDPNETGRVQSVRGILDLLAGAGKLS